MAKSDDSFRIKKQKTSFNIQGYEAAIKFHEISLAHRIQTSLFDEWQIVGQIRNKPLMLLMIIAECKLTDVDSQSSAKIAKFFANSTIF